MKGHNPLVGVSLPSCLLGFPLGRTPPGIRSAGLIGVLRFNAKLYDISKSLQVILMGYRIILKIGNRYPGKRVSKNLDHRFNDFYVYV